ncbi:MAG: T9SS type A sorting domain-containing protein [candidate division Zixibacteria bacterium]|nr:T9SS type A sorting domain-containing protein [candidate division Zixibacteria bacterium]
MKKEIIRNWLLVTLFIGILFTNGYSDENSWSTNGPYGSSVKTIAIHPFDNQIIYIGTVENGIYKTTNGGESWNHLDNGNIFSCMRVIAIHPFAPDTIYIACTDGMFKSSDAGVSWTFLTPPRPHNEIRALMIHPVETNLLFAGFIDPWMSTDSGQNWFRIEGISYNSGIHALAVDPDDPDIIYLLVANSLEHGEGIWKSTDRGSTWINIHNNINSTGFGMDISIDPFNTNTIYLALDNTVLPSDSSCLWKSTNGGQHWFDIAPRPLSYPTITSVKVSHCDRNEIYAASFRDGVFKSTDGGNNWQSINNGLNFKQITTIEIDSSSGTIYIGTYYDGIYRSTNSGESWQKISNNICSLGIISLALDYHNSSSAYVAALNGFLKTTDSSQSWDYVNMGDIGHRWIYAVAYDKYLPENVYLSTGHTIWPPVDDCGIFRSTDYGETWNFLNNGLPGEIRYRTIRIAYFDGLYRRIFLCSTSGLFYSDDIGESWFRCENGLPAYSSFNSIEVSSADPNYIAVGDTYNRVFISSDKGNSWQQTSRLPITDGWYINDIEFHPDDPNNIFVAEGDVSIFETTDGGDSWVDISNDLPLDPDIPVVSGITINPLNPQNMFAASNHYGIFQSHNGGQNWESFNVGMDTTDGVGEIMFALGDTTTLFFASSMRSVWSITRTGTGIASNNSPLPARLSLSNYPNPFNSRTVIDYNIAYTGKATLTIYDMLGRKVETLVNCVMPPGSHQAVWQADNQPSGVYFYKLQTGDDKQTQKMLLLR